MLNAPGGTRNISKGSGNHFPGATFHGRVDFGPPPAHDRGSYIETADWAPLSFAAANGHKVLVQLLLDRGAHTEAADEMWGRTPLWRAAENGHEAVVRLLLDRGAHTEAADEKGRTPLWRAAEEGHEAVVRLLLDRGAHTEAADMSGRTPLSLAAGKGSVDLVQLLLQYGADPRAKNTKGQKAPLLWAAESDHKEIIDLLLERMVTISDEGPGLLETAVTERCMNLIQALLSQHFNYVAQGTYGWLADLRELGLEEPQIVDLVVKEAADGNSPWISANVSRLPDPKADIDTRLHQPHCAHKRRDTQPSDDSIDPVTEYFSREDMQRRVSLFCGLAGVIPPMSESPSDFGLVTFDDERACIKVFYSDPRNGDESVPAGKSKEAAEATTTSQHALCHARLIPQLHRALRGFTNAAIKLQQAGFCCDQFTVLTAGESVSPLDSTPTVHMNTIKFHDVVRLAQNIEQLQHEELDSPALARSVETCTAIMASLFKSTMPRPSTTEHQLHLCSLTVQLLCLGIVFYAQAHTGRLHPSYLVEPLAKVEIRGSSHGQPYIIAEQAELACMGEMVGDKVFVFHMSAQTPPAEVRSYLNATCEEIVDSWGPASILGLPESSEKEMIGLPESSEEMIGLVIRGGIIRRREPFGNSDRLFHWTDHFGGNKLSPHDTFSYTEKIVVGATVEARSTHFATTDGICEDRQDEDEPQAGYSLFDGRPQLITGESVTALDTEAEAAQQAQAQREQASRPASAVPEAVPEAAPVTIHTGCPRDIEKSYGVSWNYLDELGTTDSCWKLVAVQYFLQGGLHVVGQVGGESQKQPGVCLKAKFLDRWDRHMRLADFESRLGLQVSLCTGVARRVPLRILVRDDLMSYIDSLYVNGWEDLKGPARAAMASKQAFAEWAHNLNHNQRRCLQEVFSHVLYCIKDTGFDKNELHFSILWPYKSAANRCFNVQPQDKNEWYTMFKDKEWSATFAVATNQCLVADEHPCSEDKEVVWPGIKTLFTSMCLRRSGQDPSLVGDQPQGEWQIKHKKWYWHGVKSASDWFLAQKRGNAVAKLEFQNNSAVWRLSRRMKQEILHRALRGGVLVEVSDVHAVGEEAFVVRRR
ncbi:hypothetical protein NW757_013251 [Fusarium falciforme]|nr:hypothetical protein NW757_013251 [Fusarium falciforme]